MIASGDKYASDLFAKWKPTVMTPFPALSTEDIDAVIKYVDEYKAPQAPGGSTAGATSGAPDEDNTWLYSLITLALLLLAIILWRVNAGLKRVTADAEGQPIEKEIPLYRNKLVIAIVTIVV